MAEVAEGVTFKGRKVRVTWKDQRIRSMRERSLSFAGDPVDITTDDDDGWRRLAHENGPTQRNVDFTASGVLKHSDLREDMFMDEATGTLIIDYPTGHRISGTAVLTAYNETGAYNDAVMFDVSWQFSGVVSYDYTPS